MARAQVTVVVAEFESFENRQIVVLEGHIDGKEAVRKAKVAVCNGWTTNHNLPYDIANLIANSYSYFVEFANVILAVEPL